MQKDLQSLLIKKAWEDAEFKKELIESPKETIQKMFEIVLPENLKINVVEEASDSLYLVLPQNPATTGTVSEEVKFEAATYVP